jgi:hypothetical protein
VTGKNADVLVLTASDESFLTVVDEKRSNWFKYMHTPLAN